MNAHAIRHPIRWWRWLRRAAYMRDNDPACYRLAYAPKLCCVGKLVMWGLCLKKTGRTSMKRSTAAGTRRNGT